MVDRRIGRTESPEIGHRRLESRRRAEAQDRDMWKPRSLLPLVHAELLQPLGEARCQAPALACLVLQDDHADAPSLAVALWGEDDFAGRSSRIPKSAGDSLELRGGPGAEEGERDVEMLARDDSPAAKVFGLPTAEGVQHGIREPKGTEETQAVTAPDGTGRAHA